MLFNGRKKDGKQPNYEYIISYGQNKIQFYCTATTPTIKCSSSNFECIVVWCDTRISFSDQWCYSHLSHIQTLNDTYMTIKLLAFSAGPAFIMRRTITIFIVVVCEQKKDEKKYNTQINGSCCCWWCACKMR